MMKRPIFAGLALFCAIVAFGDGASALTKKQQKAANKCTHNLNVCNVDCGNYKDLDATDACLHNCADTYDICLGLIKRSQGIVLPENNITEQPDPSQSQ